MKQTSTSLRIDAAIIILATILAYVPAMGGGFIWDDNDHLTEKPAMTAPHGLRQIWSSVEVSRYYPLTLTTFWVERRLWGLNPMPYHVVNIVIHVVNAALVFILLSRLKIPAAWPAAFVWALHPVNVETVAWITELKNTQSGLLFFLSLLCWLRFRALSKHAWYWLALVCYAAAILSKPSTVPLPLLLLLYAWWQREKWKAADFLRLVPFFVLAGGMSLLAVIEQRGQILSGGRALLGSLQVWSLPIAQRCAIAGFDLWFYAGKLLWPFNLSFVYPRWQIDTGSLISFLPLAGAAGIAGGLWGLRRHLWARTCLFGYGYFAIMLLPVLGFFNIYYFVYSFVADHFQYLAGVGLIALFAGAGAKICERTGRLGGYMRRVGFPVILVILALGTWVRASVFRDVLLLWPDTLAKNPQAWMAHSQLGSVLLGAKRPDEAIQHYQEALRIKPDASGLYDNLGAALHIQGKPEKAIPQFEQALRIKPDDIIAHHNLGQSLELVGRLNEAIGHYEQALRIEPDSAELELNLGEALARAGRVKEAIAHCERALQLSPNLTEARNALAQLRARQ